MNDVDAEKLAAALQNAFGGKVTFERTAVGRYAFEVTTKAFDDVSPRARQDRVWQVVDDTLDRDTSAGITLIVAYAPGDFDAERQLRELQEAFGS
jgi:hypothetical protein